LLGSHLGKSEPEEFRFRFRFEREVSLVISVCLYIFISISPALFSISTLLKYDTAADDTTISYRTLRLSPNRIERLQAHTPTYLHPYLTNNAGINSTTTRLQPNISISSSNPCSAQCPEDPYARAGMIIFPHHSDFSDFPDPPDEDGNREYDPAMTRWAPFPPLERERDHAEQDGMTGIGRVKGMRTKAVDKAIDERARARGRDGGRNRDPAGAGSWMGKKLTDSEKEEEESGAGAGAGAGAGGWGWGWGWDRVKGQDQGRRIDRREQRRDRSRPETSRRQEDGPTLSLTSPYTVALSNKDEELIGFARGRVGLFVGTSSSSFLISGHTAWGGLDFVESSSIRVKRLSEGGSGDHETRCTRRDETR
jgi:hypothetical protein